MKMKNLTTVSFCAFVILVFGLACNLSQKEDTSVDKKSADNTKSETSETVENSQNEAPAPKDISGNYEISGANETGGGNYKGTLDVTKRDEVYQMSWKVGADSYDGVAVRSGNTLAVAYTAGTNGKGCGAIVYKINADNSLEGIWGEWGVNSTGTEKAVPDGELSGSVGTFGVSGKNADGSSYTGKLKITKGGNDVYQFAWDTGTKFSGTGIKMGDYLAAGSGAKQCGFVIYEVKGETLEGKWGIPGSTALGTEKATKK